MNNKQVLDNYVQQSLTSLQRKEHEITFPIHPEYVAKLTTDHYTDYFNGLNNKGIHAHEITLTAANMDLYSSLIELYENGIPIPCNTLNITVNNDLIANKQLLNLIKKISSLHLIDINLIADEAITEENIQTLSEDLQTESIYINLTLPNPWQNSSYQMQIDDFMLDEVQRRKFTPQTAPRIRPKIKIQGGARNFLKLPTANQGIQVDYEEEQEQEHDIVYEEERESAQDTDTIGSTRKESDEYTEFKDFPEKLMSFNNPENRLFAIGTNKSQMQASFAKWINKVNLRSAKINKTKLSPSACIELAKHNEQFSQGLDLHRLPPGFEIKTTRTGIFIDFNEQAKKHAKYNPLAVQTREPLPYTRIPNNIFQAYMRELSEENLLKNAWTEIVRRETYSREGYQIFRDCLPKLSELSEESQGYLISACSQHGQFNFTLMKFLLENSHLLPSDATNFTELFENHPQLEEIFVALIPNFKSLNHTEAGLNNIFLFLQSYKNKPYIPLEGSFLYKALNQENRESLRTLHTAFPDIDLTKLLPLAIPETNNQLSQLAEMYASNPEIFTKLYNDIYQKNGRFQDLLSETTARDIAALQGLQDSEKELWDALYLIHVTSQKDSNLHDLISAFKSFKEEMRELNLPIEGPFNFKNVTSLPNTLSNILTILQHTDTVNQATVWQELKNMDLSNTGAIQTQAAYLEGDTYSSNSSQNTYQFLCEEMLLDNKHTDRDDFFEVADDYDDVKFTLENCAIAKGESVIFRYIASLGKKAQLPLDFYKDLRNQLNRSRLSPKNRIKLFAILAESTCGRINACSAQKDLQKTQKYCEEIIKLIQRVNLAGQAEVIIQVLNETGEIPPIDALRNLAKFVSANALFNRRKIFILHERLKNQIRNFGGTIYAGMNDYTDDDYKDSHIFQNFLDTADQINNLKSEMIDHLTPFYGLAQIKYSLDSLTSPPDPESLKDLINQLINVEKHINRLKQDYPNTYNEKNMCSLQEVIDILQTDSPNIDAASQALQQINTETQQRQHDFTLGYTNFGLGIIKLISTFSISLNSENNEVLKSLITPNIRNVNTVLSILSNISQANNPNHNLSFDDLLSILSPVANMSAEESAAFSENDYLENFTLEDGTLLNSFFPENYFETQRQAPINAEILEELKDLDESDKENIIQILRNFNKPNDRANYKLITDSLLAIKDTVEPHQFKKLLKKINQNPDLFVNESELLDHPFLELLSILNSKRQVQCLTIFLSRAQQIKNSNPDNQADYELADKALIFIEDLLSSIRSIDNMSLKQKEYIPMLVDTVLNAHATDLTPTASQISFSSDRESPTSVYIIDNLSPPSSLGPQDSDTTADYNQATTQSLLGSRLIDIFERFNTLVQRYPSAHPALVNLYHVHVANFKESEQTSIVQYLDIFIDSLGNAFANLEEDDILALCVQFNTKKLQPHDLQELLTYIQEQAPEHQSELIRIALATINDDRGYNLSDFKELISRYIANSKEIENIYKRAPIPRLNKVIEWIDNSDLSITDAYNEYCKKPCERDDSCGFDTAEAESQWALFTGVPDSCQMVDFEDFRNITLFMRELSIDELLEVFYKDNQSDELLVAAAAELRHRSKGQDKRRKDGSLKPGCSEELNTTQYLAALVALKSGKLVAEQMLTGQGKTRTTAVIDACKQRKGYTVDKITSDMALARRDYLMAKSFYNMLGISSNLISASSRPNQYIKGGINFSDIYNINSFRNKACSNGQQHLVIHEDINKRYASIDEADKIFDMSMMRMNISMQADAAIQNMPWVYPLMLLYFADVRDAYVDPELSVEKFMNYAALSPSVSEEQFARLEGVSSDIIQVWQESALASGTLNIGKVFDVLEDQVVFTSTGIQEVNQAIMLVAGSEAPKSKFSKGVYQFLEARLQLIHDGKLKTENTALNEALQGISSTHFDIPEEKTIVFSSSMIDMIFDYDSILFMSGTTGHYLERIEAELLYSGDEERMVHIDVPPHKKLQRQDAITAVKNSEQRFEKIIQDIMDAKERNQPILIFTTDNVENERILRAIRERFPDDPNIQDITSRTNLEDEDEVDNIFANAAKPGFITVATERAGRGFDFYVEQDAEERGLHTILTFLPKNQRDYEQMIGRSGRMGKPGSTNLILNQQDMPSYIFNTPPNLEAGLKKYFDTTARDAQVHRLINITYLLFHRSIRHSLYTELLQPEVISKLSTEQHEKIKKTYGNWLAKANNIWNRYLPEINEQLTSIPLSVDQIENISMIMQEYQSEVQNSWNITLSDLNKQLAEVDENLVGTLIEDLPDLKFHPNVIKRLTDTDTQDTHKAEQSSGFWSKLIIPAIGGTVAAIITAIIITLGIIGLPYTLPSLLVIFAFGATITSITQNLTSRNTSATQPTQNLEKLQADENPTPSLRSQHSYSNILSKLEQQEITSHKTKKTVLETIPEGDEEKHIEQEKQTKNQLFPNERHNIHPKLIDSLVSGRSASTTNAPPQKNK